MTTNAPNPNGKQTGRAVGGRFAAGNKESPGRPRGRGAVAELRDALATDLVQIIATLKAQALAGDAQAIRIILDRVLPSLRPVELPAALDLPEGGTLAEQARAVVQAAAAGDLAPGQAVQIITALGGVAKIVEATELMARIEALEARSSLTRGQT
jgi:hypothetical protein